MTDTSMTPAEALRPTDRLRSDRDEPLEVRLAMLANGYEPMPLIGKAPIPKRWQQIAINEEVVRRLGQHWPQHRHADGDERRRSTLIF